MMAISQKGSMIIGGANEIQFAPGLYPNIQTETLKNTWEQVKALTSTNKELIVQREHLK